MKPIAAGLAGLGRNGDSMLVHMQPREVAGLQRLAMAHGGSLTVNPETGLPEAGFLGDVLGAVAPIALGAFLGPGAFGIQGLGMSALGAGLTTGLLGYALTGDLGKGVMAGLGGYGGHVLGTAIQGATATVPTVRTIGETTANAAANQAAQQTAASSLANVADDAVAGNLVSSVSQPGVMGAGSVLPQGYAGVQGLPGAMSGARALPESAFRTVSGFDAIKAAPLEFIKNNPGAAFTAASPFLAAAAAPPEYKPPAAEEKTPYEGPYYPTQRDARFPTQEERQQLGTKEYQYFTPIHPYPGYEKYDPNYRGYAEGGDVNETPDPGSDPRQDAQEAMQYGIGGIAQFADGGSTAEKNYGLSTVSNQSYDSYAIPPSYLKDQIDAREKQITDLMNPYGEKNSPQSNMGIAGFLGRVINPVLNPGLTRAQAEAKVGPAPTWNPSTPSAPMQGPTTAYTGSGITALPQRQPTQNLNLAQGFSDMSRDIINSGGAFAKGGYLDGPGDGMSDSIPATIADKQPARLADGEFVVPADVVSHLGNGSTKAGAQRLYSMMDKVRKARTGTTKQGKQINPNKYMPA